MTARAKLLFVAVICFLAGALAVQTFSSVNAQNPPAAVKKPTWMHGMNLKARNWNEAEFTDSTRRVGIECFKDENNGNLIYISETGSIAVVPGK